VNGRGGTQVIVNDRVLKETGEELVAYLENLKAEDILKIEVIPYAGAEYDANATGGVIKITLKKQREEGLEGAVSMRYYTSIVDQKAWNYQPSLNLNYKYNALSLYSTAVTTGPAATWKATDSWTGTGSWMQTPVWHIANPTPLFNWAAFTTSTTSKASAQSSI
jgi:outer membrane receptor protein involved in Fe transport